MYPVPAACGARLTILPPPSTLGMVQASCLSLTARSGRLLAFPAMDGEDMAEKGLPVHQNG